MGLLSLILAIFLLPIMLGQQLILIAMDVVVEVGDPLLNDAVTDLGGFHAANGVTKLIQHAE